MIQVGQLYVAAAIAAIFSFVAIIFTGADYVASSHNLEIVEVLASNQDAPALKAKLDVADTGDDLMLNAFKAQYEEMASLRLALLQLASDRKANALKICVAWIGFSMVLSWLTIRLKQLNDNLTAHK